MPGSHPLQTPCPQVTKKFELDDKIVNPLFIIQFFFVLYVPCFVILLALKLDEKKWV
jgi:phage shock protein PspC (stress-responsive transcriptional regulator)